MIAAVRSLLDNAEGDTDDTDNAGDTTDERRSAPTIRGEPVAPDTEVVTCGGSSIYHYQNEEGRPACRHNAEARTATRRALEPHHRPCRDCFDAPAADS